MPNQTIIDLSDFTAEELREEIAGLEEELELAKMRVAQIEHDIKKALEALSKM